MKNLFNQLENPSSISITSSELKESPDIYGWNSFFEEISVFTSSLKENSKNKENEKYNQKAGHLNLESAKKTDWTKSYSSSLSSPTVVWPSTSRSGKIYKTSDFNSMNNQLNWLDAMKTKVKVNFNFSI